MYSISQIQKTTEQEFKQRYEFLEMIDAGTYGIVSKYHDKIDNQPVAGKILKDTQGLPSFLNEEQIMKKVKHQNILECLGLFFNQTKSYYILITHFCEKKNLKQNLPQIVNLDQKTKIWLCLQIARGINALHELNIMHRDIKPANILLQNDWKIKLCDFGFGKQDLSSYKSIKVGTPLYRDPNIQFGKYTKKCDIYSVGLVFDTIFRGQCCLKDMTGKHIAQQLMHFKQNKKKIIGKLQCSEQIKQIILKCLQNNQNNRYSSLELLKKLQEIWKKLNPQKQNEMIEEIPNKNQQTSLFHSFIQNNNQLEISNQSSFLVMRESTPKIRCKTEVQSENSKNQIVLGLSLSEIKPISETPSKNSQSPSKSKSKTSKKNSLKDLSLGPKKNISLSQKQNTNFFLQLLKLSQKTDGNLQKCQNFQIVYQYFINRQKKIRFLQQLVKSLATIQKNDQKVLIFIGLFGYLRFLIIHENYLKTKNSKTVTSIEGIKIDKISQTTISQCLKIIKSQTFIISESIKPLMKTINEDKIYYKQKLTKNVLNMISVGIEKKFLPIQSQFTTKQIKQEFINFVMHERYRIQNIKQNQIKEKIKNIGDIF